MHLLLLFNFPMPEALNFQICQRCCISKSCNKHLIRRFFVHIYSYIQFCLFLELYLAFWRGISLCFCLLALLLMSHDSIRISKEHQFLLFCIYRQCQRELLRDSSFLYLWWNFLYNIIQVFLFQVYNITLW